MRENSTKVISQSMLRFWAGYLHALLWTRRLRYWIRAVYSFIVKHWELLRWKNHSTWKFISPFVDNPSRRSYILMVPSWLADTKVELSIQETSKTWPECPSIPSINVQVLLRQNIVNATGAKSKLQLGTHLLHNATTFSECAEAKIEPSGENASLLTCNCVRWMAAINLREDLVCLTKNLPKLLALYLRQQSARCNME